jgi:hypothetical protein
VAGSPGLKARRSGGNANRSLTTWLNVPVVRRIVRVKFERSHKISLCSTSVGIGESAFCSHGLQNPGRRSGGEFVHSEQISGFKREFDPGSESTLAACLTHASRTRKWSNP